MRRGSSARPSNCPPLQHNARGPLHVLPLTLEAVVVRAADMAAVKEAAAMVVVVAVVVRVRRRPTAATARVAAAVARSAPTMAR